LLEELPSGAVVIYRARSARDVIFHRELECLAQTRSARIYFVFGSRSDPGPAWATTAKGLRHLVPDICRRDVFLCGPADLVEAVVEVLRHIRLSWRQIHVDPFEF
jgi:ferredoxin-NADP reductase